MPEHPLRRSRTGMDSEGLVCTGKFTGSVSCPRLAREGSEALKRRAMVTARLIAQQPGMLPELSELEKAYGRGAVCTA